MRRRAAALMCVMLSAGPAAAQGPVVAEVGGRTITRDEFRAWLRVLRTEPAYAQSTETVTPEGQRRLLQRLVTQELFAAAGADAARMSAVIDPTTPEAADIAERYARQVTGTPTEADVRAFYDARPDRFRTGGRVKASHILLASRDEAAAALADVRAGKPFADVARARSRDAMTASAGGSLGWITRGVMVKPFEEAVFALQAHATSGVVQTGYGFHVIRAEAVEEGTLLPFDAVRDLARQALAADRIAAEQQRLMARLGARIYPEALAEGAR